MWALRALDRPTLYNVDSTGLWAFSFPYCDARKELSDINEQYSEFVNWNIENIEQLKYLRSVCVRLIKINETVKKCRVS